MRRHTILALSLTLLATVAVAAPEGVPKFPADAYGVEDYTVPGSETMQAAFLVRSPYPGSAIIDHYVKGVSTQWAICRGPSDGWQAYVDKSGKSPKLVHQHIRYWVNFEQDKMMTVIVRHYSKASKVLCEPDNDVQHGVLVVSQSPELDKEIQLLRLTCDAAAAFVKTIPVARACTGN